MVRSGEIEISSTTMRFMDLIDKVSPDKVLSIMFLVLILFLIQGYIAFTVRRIIKN